MTDIEILLSILLVATTLTMLWLAYRIKRLISKLEALLDVSEKGKS